MPRKGESHLWTGPNAIFWPCKILFSFSSFSLVSWNPNGPFGLIGQGFLQKWLVLFFLMLVYLLELTTKP